MKIVRSLGFSVGVAAIVASTSGAIGAPLPTTGSGSAATSLPQAPASTDPRARDLRWRNIGPANMMGRIAAIEALSTDYRHVLVASASGGVFKSTNAGITWDPIFDNSGGAGSIGSVAMFEPDPDIIWVGTGEAANRNSSGWGNGVFRTTDGGRTWDHVGLETTHHIAQIALHPTDPDIAYAASPGHLWGYSGDRGLFMPQRFPSITAEELAAWADRLSAGSYRVTDEGEVEALLQVCDRWRLVRPQGPIVDRIHRICEALAVGAACPEQLHF
ncbi:MAG: hypothetical protein IH849_08635 [Acidobacteria bacterium]|nr:hypothetical protein [Acidobacteriota bacterium]